MPTFIRMRREQKVNKRTEEIVMVDNPYTDEEIAELRREHPNKFVTVPESHAADVIRPQANYQEVPDATDEQTRTDEAAKPARSHRSPAGRSGKGASSKSNTRVG